MSNKTAKLKEELDLIKNQLAPPDKESEKAQEDAYRFEKFLESLLEDIEHQTKDLNEKLQDLQKRKKSVEVSLKRIQSGNPYDSLASLNSSEPRFLAAAMMKDKELSRIVQTILYNFRD